MTSLSISMVITTSDFGNKNENSLTTGDGFDWIVMEREPDGFGGFEGHGHDIVTDFDPLTDLLLIEYDADVETYDPFGDLTQTVDGVLITPTLDSSVLLMGVDIADLNSSNLAGWEESGNVSVLY